MFANFSVQMLSWFSPKVVLRSSFYIYNICIKCLIQVFYDIFGPNTLMTITVEDVELPDEVMSPRLSKVNGKAASRAKLVGYKR